VVFEQKRDAKIQTDKLIIKKGKLEVKKLSFGLPKNLKSKNVIIKINGKKQNAKVDFKGGKVIITFPEKITLTEKEKIKIRIGE